MLQKFSVSLAGVAALAVLMPSVGALDNRGVAKLPGKPDNISAIFSHTYNWFQSWVTIVSSTFLLDGLLDLPVHSLAWNAFQCAIDEALMLRTANLMKTLGLQARLSLISANSSTEGTAAF